MVTKGVHDVCFNIKNTNQSLRVIDIGGQKAERNKWIHHFEDVFGILFVAAISEYDQYADDESEQHQGGGNNVNALSRCIALFKEFLQIKYFRGKPVILFLNKIDLFKSKLSHSNLRDNFPDYNGNDNDDF